MLERAAWTFAQAFLAVFVVSDLASADSVGVLASAATSASEQDGTRNKRALREAASGRRFMGLLIVGGCPRVGGPALDRVWADMSIRGQRKPPAVSVAAANWPGPGSGWQPCQGLDRDPPHRVKLPPGAQHRTPRPARDCWAES